MSDNIKKLIKQFRKTFDAVFRLIFLMKVCPLMISKIGSVMAYLVCNNCKTENKAKVFECFKPIGKTEFLGYFLLQVEGCSKCNHIKNLLVALLPSGEYKDLEYLKTNQFEIFKNNIVREIDRLPIISEVMRYFPDKKQSLREPKDLCFKIIVGEATTKMAHNTVW